MNNSISIKNLQSVVHGDVVVITTDLLASLYGTNTDNIKKNYSRNADRFVEGKHYFKLEGHELKEFKNKVTLSHLVASRSKHLILWTERGAARHAKMLETDQAWEVFEALEDFYFTALHDHFTGRKEVSSPRTAEREQTPRYFISMHVRDSRSGEDVVFTGTCDTIESIISGTAAKFGMRIVDMRPLPALVH